MFEVEWRPGALNELTNAWLAADGPGRQAITAAVRRIDHALSQNPLDTGESREGNRRIHFDAPLVVVFRVFEAARRVRVSATWPIPRRRS